METDKPRGILKNPASVPAGRALVWDEANLSLNEVQKDSTMKITEPKTPYVRYDAETDTVMDLDKIPGFELGRADDEAYVDQPDSSPQRSNSNPTSRRGSAASEKMVKVDAGPMPAGEDDDDELADEDTVAHRKQFAASRRGHYKNEAEAMKKHVEPDDEESSGVGEENASSRTSVPPPVPPMPTNGTSTA